MCPFSCDPIFSFPLELSFSVSTSHSHSTHSAQVSIPEHVETALPRNGNLQPPYCLMNTWLTGFLSCIRPAFFFLNSKFYWFPSHHYQDSFYISPNLYFMDSSVEFSPICPVNVSVLWSSALGLIFYNPYPFSLEAITYS